MDHAVAGGDVPMAARLVTSLAQSVVNAGRSREVQGWIEALGDAGPAAYPPMAVVAAWVWALEGEADRALRVLATAEAAVFSGRPADGSASLASGIMTLRAAMALDGVDQMLVDARGVLEMEPPGSNWHPLASLLLGVGELLHGNREAAVKAFRRVTALGRERQGPAALVALGQLALLEADQDPQASARLAGEAQAILRARRLQDHPASMIAHAASATVASRAGDPETGEHHVAEALRLSGDAAGRVVFPWLSTQVAVAVGRVQLASGDVVAARSRVVEARAYLAPLRTQGDLRGQVRALADDVARGGGRAPASGLAGLTQAELRVLRLLPTYLTLAEIGERLDVSRNTVKSQTASVYRKLRASTRAEAVHRAQDLGIVDTV